MSPNNDITSSIHAQIGDLPFIDMYSPAYGMIPFVGDTYPPAYGMVSQTTIFELTGPACRSPSLAFATCGDDQAAPVEPQHSAFVELQHPAPEMESPPEEEQVLNACTKTMNSYLNGQDYTTVPSESVVGRASLPLGISPNTALRGPKMLSKREVRYKDRAKNHHLAKVKAEGSDDTLEDIVIRSWGKIKNSYSLDSKSGRHIRVLASWIEVRLLQLNLCDLTEQWRSSETGPYTVGPEPSPLSVAYLFEQAMMSSSEDFMQGAIFSMRNVAIKHFEKAASSVELDSDSDSASHAL